jgi:hypothetical protein
MRKLVQNILATSVIIAASSMAHAQYNPRARSGTSPSTAPSTGYYTGSSSYGSSVSYGHSNEIITNFSRGTIYSGKDQKNGDSRTTIDIQGKYLRVLTANIQIGGQAGFRSISGGGGQTLLTALGIGVYNFDTDIKNSFFVEGGLGIYPVLKDTGTDYESKFGLYAGGGKRFPIWERVSYIPTAALVKKGDLDFAFDIQFLNFSIMF